MDDMHDMNDMNDMNDLADPVRLMDDPATPSAVRDLLEAGRGPVFDATSRVRIEQSVHSQVSGPPSWAGKVIAGGAVAGIVALGVIWMVGSNPAPEAAGVGLSSVELPLPPQIVHDPKPVAPRISPKVAAASSNEGEPDPAPKRESVRHQDPGAEAKLLLEARRSLNANPSRALELANEHRRRFKRGDLAEEREFLAIRALLALDRQPQAQRRSRAFLSAFPSSPHRSTVQDTANAIEAAP